MSSQRTHTELWEDCRAFLRDNLSVQQYTVWFGDVKSLGFENNKLLLSTSTMYFAEQLDYMYGGLLNAAVKKVYGPGVAIVFQVEEIKGQPESVVTVRSAMPSPTIIQSSTKPAPNPFASKPPVDFDSQLNPRYNFENYCTGSSNFVARTISESIANDPTNKTFNPLFVFGPTGVGKTHLIQAVGIRIKERNPEARVLYVTARYFQHQFTAANYNGKINDFFHFYHGIDTLIIDDIQELAGKPDTQNTFFNIFNQLHQNNRQIIMSSDCAPSEMDGFEARLLGRFKWGASAALEKPDRELRRNVLRIKAEQDGLNLSDEIIDYIADNVTDSIRDLEGVVVSLMAHATVLNCEESLDLARNVVANAIRIKRKQINFEMVTEAVSSFFKLQSDTLFTKSRKREIADARQIVMYLTKRFTNMSLKSIGGRLGRSHATVIHACHTIEERLTVDKELRNSIDEIKKIIESD